MYTLKEQISDSTSRVHDSLLHYPELLRRLSAYKSLLMLAKAKLRVVEAMVTIKM